jgi:hypothetical protein
MEQDNRNITEKKQPDSGTPQKEKPVLAPGEKVFSVVLFVLGLVALGMALELWMRMSEPRIASAGALPLFVSGVWVVLAFLTVLENFKLTSPLSALKDKKEKIKQGLAYALPIDVLVILAAVLVYCILLFVGVSFYIATPLFLYGSMCYLMKKDYLKNILWTALVMAFIVLVFRMLFGVVFP